MPAPCLDYQVTFFEEIARSKLGYDPRIEIKPAHLANGLFRAICGGYANNQAQHLALYPKLYPSLDPDKLPPGNKLQNVFSRLSTRQVDALRFLHGREQERAMLYALLGADKTVYKQVNWSSYSLSHASHTTNDSHDREAGLWLHAILRKGGTHPALDLLTNLLQQSPRDRSDEISLLTLPLDNPTQQLKGRTEAYLEPDNTLVDFDGKFNTLVVNTIRQAFDQLALNDADEARTGSKLDILRHFVVLACFALYFHLANASSTTKPSPIVFRFDRTALILRQASVRSYQRMYQTVDDFFRREIHRVLVELDRSGTYGSWSSDLAIENRIRDTIKWKRPLMANDCLSFYRSYRTDTAGYEPIDALAYALCEMQSVALSSTPKDVARGLGTRIGMLSPHADRQKKTYDPHPDFLEVLVRATMPKNTTWTLFELAQKWADSFGILCGVLGDENDRIRSLGISVDQEEWVSNSNALGELLELSGYARRYADGVVLVTT